MVVALVGIVVDLGSNVMRIVEIRPTENMR